MTEESKAAPTRAAIYAQERRDNEIQARTELQDRLPEKAFDLQIESRGDLNRTTKVLAFTLLLFDPRVTIFGSASRHEKNSAEYNALRRSNENEVREELRKRIPQSILEQEFMSHSNLNPTTKIIVAAAKHLDELKQGPQISQMTASSSPMVIPSPLQNLKVDLDLNPPPMPTKRSSQPVHNNEAQRPWEEDPFEEHPVEEIRHLEQVAKRLVAKAKTMVEPTEEPHRSRRGGYQVKPDDLTKEERKDLNWMTDLMIDAISVIEGKEEKRRVTKKWAGVQKEWGREYALQ